MTSAAISGLSSCIVEPDLLCGLAHELDIGAGLETKVELYRREVAAEIGHGAELAIGDRVQRAVVVAQLDRADAERLDGALEPSGIDVLADPERVVPHVEQTGDDVADQRLRAERHRQPEHAGAGDQRRGVDAEPRQHDQYRQDRRSPRRKRRAASARWSAAASRGRLLVVVARPAALARAGVLQIAVDRQPGQLPGEIGDEQASRRRHARSTASPAPRSAARVRARRSRSRQASVPRSAARWRAGCDGSCSATRRSNRRSAPAVAGAWLVVPAALGQPLEHEQDEQHAERRDQGVVIRPTARATARRQRTARARRRRSARSAPRRGRGRRAMPR